MSQMHWILWMCSGCLNWNSVEVVIKAEMEEEWNYPEEATTLTTPHMDHDLHQQDSPCSQESNLSPDASQIEEFPGKNLSANQHQHLSVKAPASFQTRKWYENQY